MKKVMLRLRVEPEFKKKLEDAIANGRARSMSELIRCAVDRLIEEPVFRQGENQNGNVDSNRPDSR
jgi:Arc/MetJ-type ribon-helix-helix transcriptional regulator